MDTLSASAASRLATRIQLYWVSRGVTGVQVWAEPFSGLGEDGKPATLFQVRSNIVDRLCHTKCLSS